MGIMDDMFVISGSYIPALIAAIDEYYHLIENMSTDKQGVCASFIMGLQNYTSVIAHHMAMLEGTWTVTGDHIDMAKEILYDLYQNLIHWLESEVKVGQADSERKKIEKSWKTSYARCEQFDFPDGRGEGWVKKSELRNSFGELSNFSSPSTVNTKYNEYGARIFEETREGQRIYVKLREDHRKGGKI